MQSRSLRSDLGLGSRVATRANRRPTSRSDSPKHPGNELAAEFDLASRWVGGSVLAASDESFGEKESLLNPEAARFEPGHYGARGEIVDGWETRRRREAGHDWALVRLGTPGIITSVDVDTSFFTGNFPPFCQIEACGREGYPSPAELNDAASEWVDIVPRTPVRGDTHNIFPVSDPRRFTHVRLATFPDGGVARLRVFGRVVPDPRLLDGVTVDLVSQELGGAVIASSDSFYTSARVLNRPDRARSMGEGWETRRRRDPGNDYVVFHLALAGHVRQLIVDAAHFRYNASAEIAVFGSVLESVPSVEAEGWIPLLRRTRLLPDTRHIFPIAHSPGALYSIRLDAFPDGGLSRVRVLGTPDPAARRRAGYRWFSTLPATQAQRCLVDAGVPPDIAAEVCDHRSAEEGWLATFRDRFTGKGSLGEASYFRALAAMLEGPSAQLE